MKPKIYPSKEYPKPTPMAIDETLRSLHTRYAGDAPNWFSHKELENKPEIVDDDDLGLIIWDKDYHEWLLKDQEERYFQWKLYYADKMIRLLNKK